jgi:hypothetical protein
MAGTQRSCRKKRASSRKPKKCRKSKPRSCRKSARKSARKSCRKSNRKLKQKLHCNGKTYSTKKVAGYSATCKDGKAKLVNTKKCYARGACEGKKKMTGEKFFDVFPEMSFIAGVFPN